MELTLGPDSTFHGGDRLGRGLSDNKRNVDSCVAVIGP